jgi:N-acetylneuraminate synthase
MKIFKKKMLVAEIGSVHDGSIGNAKKLIELAAKSGADAVKFQTHIAHAESILSAPNPSYFKSETRIDYFKRTSFDLAQWKELKNISDKLNLFFISSPFSLEAVDLLKKIDLDIYKIPSGEVTNLPLLEKISKLRKTVFLSSGMSNWRELDKAVSIFKDKCDLVIFQCSSMYPCSEKYVGLNVLNEIKKRYNCSVGFSDHTLGVSAPIAAAALGAVVIEKHFTFSKHMYGSDAKHSMEPVDFKKLSMSLKEVWNMINKPINKDNLKPYLKIKKIFEKYLVASKNLKKGTKLKFSHMSFKKTGGIGIPAKHYKKLIGKKLNKRIEKDFQFKWLNLD